MNFTPSPGTGDLLVNPNFVNPTSGDFSLNSTSQLINAGQSGYDMGAVPYTVRPLMPTDLEIVTEQLQYTADLSWVNPSENTDGSLLTALDGVLILRNGEVIADLTDMTPGAPAQHLDTVPFQGYYRYKVLAYTSVNGIYAFTKELWIGPAAWALPTGPDAYGYVAYESVDAGGPTFDWIEIDPGAGGSGTVLNFTQDDETFHIDLPFTFKYYGLEYDQVSICSNGWIALGITDETDYSNSAIPNSDGPPAMLAPFWEDLSPQQSGSVSTYYDAVNHWFIVEYYWVRQYLPETAFETFEAILYDPAHHTTVTGDGKILFQWLDVTDPTQATFGIENQVEAVGLQMGLDNSYPTSVAGIQDEYAILFAPPEENFPVAVTLTPENPPIVIPAVGGSFSYTANLSAPVNMETFDVWIEAILPNGSVYGPMLARTLTLQAGQNFSRYMTQNVPGSAPAGDYSYRCSIGNSSLGIIWSQDQFSFIKSGTIAGGSGNWECIGLNPEELPEQEIRDNNKRLSVVNSPNPFNPTTAISYKLQASSFVNLSVYDISGRRVAELVNGWRDAGSYEVMFDGSNLASGVYIYCLELSGSGTTMGRLTPTTISGKMVLMK